LLKNLSTSRTHSFGIFFRRPQDMGIKTVANDLDNARVWFDQVKLPRDALLNKFCEVDATTGAYVQKGDEKMRIEVSMLTVGVNIHFLWFVTAAKAAFKCNTCILSKNSFPRSLHARVLSAHTYSLPLRSLASAC